MQRADQPPLERARASILTPRIPPTPRIMSKAKPIFAATQADVNVFYPPVIGRVAARESPQMGVDTGRRTGHINSAARTVQREPMRSRDMRPASHP